MKNIVSVVLAGLVGGAVALGGTQLLQNHNAKNQNTNPTYARLTGINSNNTSTGLVDLTQAAATASATVVFIEAAESPKTASKRQRQIDENDPFALFFGGGGFQQPAQKGTGSGVIVSTDGYIVTNNHVVDFADEVNVTLSDNRKYKAKIVGTDPRTDLAVLKIEADGLPAIPKGNSDALKVGEWVLAIGNPFQLRSTVTAGIVSAKGKELGVNREKNKIESFIQTDAVVNPGNSGGALVDAQGRLVGINTAIQTHTGSYEGYSFAIPVNLMSKIVDDLIQNGSVKRAALGVQYVPDEYFREETEKRDIDINQGVLIDKVVNGGAAQYAGLLPNDVITQINGASINTSSQLLEKINSSKVGETLNLTVFRKGQLKQIPVQLKAS